MGCLKQKTNRFAVRTSINGNRIDAASKKVSEREGRKMTKTLNDLGIGKDTRLVMDLRRPRR